MKSDKQIIDAAQADLYAIQCRLQDLTSLNGARNPHYSFRETEAALESAAHAVGQLQLLRQRFHSRAAKDGARWS